MKTANIPELVEEFLDLLESRKISFLLVGGLALLQYVEGRNTEDIDIIIAGPDLDQLPEITIEDKNNYFIKANFKGLRIDLLLSENKIFHVVKSQYASQRPFLKHTIPCANPEGLVLLKLYALPSLYRQHDFIRVNLYESDIAALLHDHPIEEKKLFQELTKHLSQGDMDSIQGIVAEIREKIRRFDAGAPKLTN